MYVPYIVHVNLRSGLSQSLSVTTYRSGTAITSTIFIFEIEDTFRQGCEIGHVIFEFTVGVLEEIKHRTPRAPSHLHTSVKSSTAIAGVLTGVSESSSGAEGKTGVDGAEFIWESIVKHKNRTEKFLGMEEIKTMSNSLAWQLDTGL